MDIIYLYLIQTSFSPSPAYPSLSVCVFSPWKGLLSHPPTLALLHFVTDSLSVACISTTISHSPVLFQELLTVLVCYTHTHTLSLLSFSFTPVIEMEKWEHLSFANGWWWRIKFLCCNAIETSPPGMRNTGWESNVLDVFAPLWTIIHRLWLLMEQLCTNLSILIPLGLLNSIFNLYVDIDHIPFGKTCSAGKHLCISGCKNCPNV